MVNKNKNIKQYNFVNNNHNNLHRENVIYRLKQQLLDIVNFNHNNNNLNTMTTMTMIMDQQRHNQIEGHNHIERVQVAANQ